MYRIRYFIILCIGLLISMSCVKFEDNKQLQEVIQTVDTDPQEALRMLETMHPKSLDKNSYMHYVVMLTQARYMDCQDITGDSLIIEAQRYFAGNHNSGMGARASFYAACFWDEKGIEEKAFEYYLLANYYAELADNLLFQAKSTYCIAFSYYNQDMLNNSLTYYYKSLELCEKVKNTDNHKLDLYYAIGKIHSTQNNSEQALIYFNKGLTAAQKRHNKDYEFLFLQNTGIYHRDKREFEEAKAYFTQALSIEPVAEDSLRLYLSYARLYKAIDQPDSTKYYLNIIKNRITEYSYPINRRTAYLELANYYEEAGNSKELKRYQNLAAEEDLKIESLKDEKSILLT